MIVDITVPEAGESVTEGLLSAWLKNEGDLVEAGEDLFEVETDKVTMAVPAPAAGRLSILVPADSEVKVRQVVGKIDTDAAEGAAEPPVEAGPAAEEPEPHVDALSPAVRRLVEEHQLDPAAIRGTGKGGRIVKGDVLAHLERAAAEPAPAPAPAPEPKKTALAGDRPETRERMTTLRKRITERLVEVQQTAAILTTFNEVDMTAVMAARNKYKADFEKKHGVRLGFMSFFLKATVDALKTVPAINGRIEGDEIVSQHYYDIGVAVGTEQGLVVPVLRAVDQMSFADIEATIRDLAVRARKRRLKLEELTGGVFTISNGGVYGSLLSTPILNPPQSGILGMHRIQKRAMVVDDEVVVRPMMYLALSYDHRLVDGEQAVAFLKRIVDCLEDPERMLLEV